MLSHRWFPQSLPGRTVTMLVLPLLLLLPAPLALAFQWQPAQPLIVQENVEQPAPAVSTLTLNLQECLQLALQRQPRLAAMRASLAAAQDGRRALDALRFAGLVAPEIPVRRQQAARGVTAAVAAVDQAERETIYAVTRTYFTVLYARQQEKTARRVVERLTTVESAAKQQLKAGARGVSDVDVKRTSAYLRLARTKQIKASMGVKRALAALKEAIGLGPDACLDIPQRELPEPTMQPCLADVVAAALARRGELIQATIFAEVTCLEVEAQGSSMHKKLETFAAGSDIHARQVPQGVQNTEYRPGAIPPEMPTLLVGSRTERIKHAQALHARANAVVETTRNLITLEAEDAYLRWEEASSSAAEAKKAAEVSAQVARTQEQGFRSLRTARAEDVVNAHVLAATAQSQYNEFLYNEILALADLERVSGGGFCARLVEALAAPVPAAPPAPKKGQGKGDLFQP